MKRKLLPLLLILAAIFQGCSGPEGPQGPRGENGVNVLGTTIDLVGVNFTAQNNYEYIMSFDDADLEVYESDAVLIYSRWKEGIYRLLPQSTYIGNGELKYNYDRTVDDVGIFLEGTVNLATLPVEYTRNQQFRVIVIPSDFAERRNGAIDYKDYNAVVKAFNIDESKFRTVTAK